MVLKVHGKHKQACKKVACHFLELGKGGNGSLRDYAKYQQQMLYYLGTEGTNYVHTYVFGATILYTNTYVEGLQNISI